jgi:fatty-acyl-CoA synthase
MLRLVGARALLVTPQLKGSDYYAILREVVPQLGTHVADRPLASAALPDLAHVISIDPTPPRGMLAYRDLLVHRSTPLRVRAHARGLTGVKQAY